MSIVGEEKSKAMIYCICSPFLAGLEDTAAAQTVAGGLPEDKIERVFFPSRFDPFTFIASLILQAMFDFAYQHQPEEGRRRR